MSDAPTQDVEALNITHTVIGTVLDMPGTDELANMSDRDFNRHIAASNEAYAALRAAYEDVCQASGDMLTEQIARHLTRTYGTDAHTLVCRAAATMCSDLDMHPDGICDGHNPTLVAACVLAADGSPIAFPDPLSPLHYWMERLTVLMGLDDASLVIVDREWFFGASDQDPTSA